MDFSFEKIKSFIQENYDLRIEIIKELDGYIDKNFLLEDENGERFILKLSTSDPLFFLEAQNKVLGVLSGASPLYPKVIKTTTDVEIIKKEDYYVRLLSFLSGQFLEDVEVPTEALCIDFGRTLASMAEPLASLEIPSLSHLQLDWDLKNSLERLPDLQLIENPARRRLTHYFLLQFKEIVIPKISGLRKSIIHNDANPMNVLVDENKVTGIIDFGDLVYSCTIFDAAIALSYLMMEQEDVFVSVIPFLQGYHKVYPLKESELSILYYLIAARLCTSLIMSASSRASSPENSYANIHEDRAYRVLQKLVAINPNHAEQVFRKACGLSTHESKDVQAAMLKRAKHISQAQSISYDEPIYMHRSALQYMYGTDGKSYLDCVNNIMHVGHCHPVVVKAGQAQLAKMNTNTRYLYDELNVYASRLLSTLPKTLDKIFFVNSGSAATDLAIRLSRAFTKRNEFVVIDQGYHGNTQMGIDVSPYKFDSKGGEGAKQNIHKLMMPDTYRNDWSASKFASELEPILDRHDIAAFIGESILGCGGQLMLPENYFDFIYQKIRAAGGICIADEVQVGFGRVGKKFWGFELQEVVPDIVIMGKPIGNGHPMAAVACTTPIAEAFENGMEFFSSFGGNPVSCEIGMAVLDVIEEESLQSHAMEMGEYILAQWESLKQKYDCIGDVRGVGLFLGMEFVKSRESKEPDEALPNRIVNEMKKQGFLLSTDGPYHNVIKFKPPMVFDKENADDLYKALDAVMDQILNT